MDEKIVAVQRMQDYIEEHDREAITLGDLASVALYSPWYCARLFKSLTGLSPADYIRRLKLSKSALCLRDETCRIIDVAYDMGFRSVDGYQRAFYREFGCNPHHYALHPIPLTLFIPYGVKFRELRKESLPMEQVKHVFLQVIEKPERKVVIKRGTKAKDYWEYCNEVGCDVWGLLTSMKSLSKEPVCLWLPKPYRPANTSEYVQGVEVAIDDPISIPEGFECITLPKATYLMVQGEPFEEEDYCEAIAQVQQAIQRYDPRIIGYQFDESNPRIQLEPIGTRGYIELIAIKPKA